MDIGRSRERRVVPLLLARSSKATSAFSVLQELLFKLKIAMIVTESSLTPNFCSDSPNKVGSELPIVAFLWTVPLSTSAEVQLLSPAVVQREPVYPFEHTHEHVDPLDTLTPPL